VVGLGGRQRIPEASNHKLFKNILSSILCPGAGTKKRRSCRNEVRVRVIQRPAAKDAQQKGTSRHDFGRGSLYTSYIGEGEKKTDRLHTLTPARAARCEILGAKAVSLS
jgi:hypothetical protein